MKLLFEAITFTEDRLVYYRMFQLVECKYFAELIQPEVLEADFTFRKIERYVHPETLVLGEVKLTGRNVKNKYEGEMMGINFNFYG
jgi:hypothetical protein